MDFYLQLLQTLFGQDQRFVVWKQDGIPAAVVEELTAFWADPRFAGLRAELQLIPPDFTTLMDSLQEVAGGRRSAGDSSDWLEVASRCEALTKRQPEAGVLVALQALAAWVGALGPQLFFQPWEGHHPGWHVFPLTAGRAMVAARAIWGARFVCETAAGFVEAAKQAPSNPFLRAVLADYRAMLAEAEKVYDESVGELAWALCTASGVSPTDDENASFRPHLAALCWTAGDVIHAELLSARGPAGYTVPYPLVRDLVDLCMVRLPRDPLLQYIWLEMKDRGPFTLRGHLELFGHLNNRFREHPLHALDEYLPFELGRLHARALIGFMRGRAEPVDRAALAEAFGLIGSMVEARAPEVSLRVRALLTLLDAWEDSGQVERWQALARMSAAILAWADRGGVQQPFDRVLDVPLHYLPVGSDETLRSALDSIEAYRKGNLGYWLAITPPPPPDDPSLESLLNEEKVLLREVRGARFIRMLPYLPRHYRRYGVNFDEAELDPPAGAEALPPGSGLLRFDPFDQRLAENTLRESLERLQELYARMRADAPEYAATRSTPPSSGADFVNALGAHAGTGRS